MPGQPLRDGASAEERFRALLDRRDAEARHAQEAANARDLLEGRRRELIDGAKALRARRDAFQEEARARKERAERLRARLRGGPGGPRRGEQRETPAEKLARLDVEIPQAERMLETTSRPLKEEKAIVEEVRRKRREADRLRRELAQVAATAPANETPAATPEELRQAIEIEFAHITQLRAAAQEAHEAMTKLSAAIDALREEADAHHKEVLEHRSRANEIHEKAMKMRELVVAAREKRRQAREEERAALTEQNEAVRGALFDAEKLKREEDEAVDALLKRGKISL